jgi:hypothetical protein
MHGLRKKESSAHGDKHVKLGGMLLPTLGFSLAVKMHLFTETDLGEKTGRSAHCIGACLGQ